MIGMIKKDIFIIQNNIKSLIAAIIIYCLFALTNNMDISFLIPFMTTMISISTFSYDDFNNWHSYAVSLPQGRNNVVKGKYITTIALTLVATIIGIILSFLVGLRNNSINIEEIFSSISGSLFAIVILISVIYPILFKFGAEKGRIGLFTFGFGIFGLAIILGKLIPIDIPLPLITFFNTYGWIMVIIISIITIVVSYLLSLKIYSKKEF